MLGIIPTNAQITIEKDSNNQPIRYCVDAQTERIMQNQRLVAMLGSTVLLGGAYFLKGSKPLRYVIGAMGVVCFFAHATARHAVKVAESKHEVQ